MSFKIAFIGAGSLVFAKTLFSDIMSVPGLRDAEIAFTDINEENMERTRALCQRDLDANGIPVKIQATTDRREAFRNARYIINCVRVGGLEGFETDIEIPLKYGVDGALVRREIADLLPRKQNLPPRRLFKPRDHAQRGGFAAAGGPEKGHKFSLSDIQADVVDRDRAVVLELPDEISDLDDVFGALCFRRFPFHCAFSVKS